MNNLNYFDNAATTRVLDIAAKAAINCMNKNFANPSSLHKLGLNSENVLTSARKTISAALNCDPNEIIFTPSATISTNLALLGSLKKLSRLKGNKILTSCIEHPATKNCLNEFKKHGFNVVEIKPTNKIYTTSDFLKEVDNTTCLVSIMHVNNENGLILPVKEISQQIKSKFNNILIHLDCVQSFAKIPIDLAQIPADFVSISGHKINAPKGVGALFIRKNVTISPIFFGGGQELNLCSGTQNVPAIAGFDSAINFHINNITNHFNHYENLKSKLISICSSNKHIKFNFEYNHNVPYIINLSIEGIRSQVMLNFLENSGFFVSSGSACSRGKIGTVLTNLGYSRKRQDSSIRISFDYSNSVDSVSCLGKAILQGYSQILKI